MFGLPSSTEYNKRIPKQKFYDNISVTPAMKKVFMEKIKSIYWRNKIAATTVNLSSGDLVTEIEVFEIKLEDQTLDECVLKQIDREIPYHIIFLLEYQGKYQAWTSYKEPIVGGKNAFKVDVYYHTDWLLESELLLSIEGLNLDDVYERFIRRIAGDNLSSIQNVSLKEAVDIDKRKKSIEKQISSLQTQIKNEKQFNRQVELHDRLKELKKELEEL